MTRKILTVALLMILVATSAGAVIVNGVPTMVRQVLSGGASESAASGNSVRATLGQPFISIVSSGNTDISQGFWAGGVKSEFLVFLPLTLR